MMSSNAMRVPDLLRAWALIVACLAAAASSAQQSPYAGDESRSIKSLSDREIRALENGEGMGLARLAELNHYPGPRHVLDLAGELGLSDEQLRESEIIFDEMQRSAIALGAQLLDAERRLDEEFARQDVLPEGLAAALMEIGSLRARLRYVHLEAHLRQRELLSSDQIETYDRLRGYRTDQHGALAGHHPVRY